MKWELEKRKRCGVYNMSYICVISMQYFVYERVGVSPAQASFYPFAPTFRTVLPSLPVVD